jgi:hypothetical protein
MNCTSGSIASSYRMRCGVGIVFSPAVRRSRLVRWFRPLVK